MKTAVGLLYKEKRIQVLNSDAKFFRALEDPKLLWDVKLLLEFNELITGILGRRPFR